MGVGYVLVKNDFLPLRHFLITIRGGVGCKLVTLNFQVVNCHFHSTVI